MRRSLVLVSCLTVAVAGRLLSVPARAQSASPLGGVWTLNRSLSEFPRDIGFNSSWLNAAGDVQGAAAGGRGRQSSSGGRGAGLFSAPPESYEEARRVQVLTAEARTPPVRQIIVDTPAAVTITDERGQSRVFHPDGREESTSFQGVPINATSKRDGDRFVVVFHAEANRDVRYTYSRSANPSRLAVEVQFLDHGMGDKATRVYEPGLETETLVSADRAPAPASAPASAPARPPQSPAESFDQRPGAELRGLKIIGILVEDLSAQAVACGLSHDALDSALTKRLADGGFTVRKNSDEDTYLYVNVITTRLSGGACVSRYDAFLYTYATAKLTHHDQPVLVQVSLMHRGGIDSNAPTLHAAAVVRGLENYVDLFVTQIHDANK